MSYTHLSTSIPTARRQHHCIWCGQKIEPGEKYIRENGVYDGEFQSNHWHPECHDDGRKYFRESGECEFTPWENERPAVKAAH